MFSLRPDVMVALPIGQGQVLRLPLYLAVVLAILKASLNRSAFKRIAMFGLEDGPRPCVPLGGAVHPFDRMSEGTFMSACTFRSTPDLRISS